MYLKILVYVLILCCAPLRTLAQEKVVTLATLTDFPPYCFSKGKDVQQAYETIPPGSDSLQLQGYSWDVVRQSFHEVGYTIVLYVLPWARVIHYLHSDRVDVVFPANRTEKREREYRFSTEFVDRTRMVAYANADSTLEWDGLSSLDGLSVGAVRGWAYGKKWESNQRITKESMDTIRQSFRVLEKKRLDAVIGYEIAYDYVLKGEGIMEKFKKLGYFGIVDEFLMGKIDNPAARMIIDEFDRGHRLVQQRGGLDAIAQKWK